MKPARLAILCLSLSLAGCASLDPTRALDSASSSAGRVVGEAIGNAMVRQYSPRMTRYYTGYLTRMAFSSQGFSLTTATRGYEPGEYTEWAVTSSGGEGTDNRLRRALLQRTDSQNEWWQVVYTDSDSGDVITMEALFSEGREQMLRLRAQFPDDDEPQELPVEEQNYQSPRVLTQESIDGATQGRETVTVPAGTFDATHVRFGNGATEEAWWLSDEVPGGVVQHRVSAASGQPGGVDGEDVPEGDYTMQLQTVGSGASSRLGI